VQEQVRPLVLAGLINRVHRVLQGIGADVAGRCNLYLGEMEALAALGRGGSAMRMGDMARAMLVSAPNATRIVKQLENRGFAERGPSAKSDREVIVRLTEKGEDAFQTCLRELETELQGALDSVLLDGEQDQLCQLLLKLAGPVS
jgi:DNA-binding MarR family transcriptional regulator